MNDKGTGLDTPVKSGSRADRQWDTWKENQPITSDLPAWPRYDSPMRAAAHRQGMLRAVGNPYGEVRV